jgi:hypothetical protein
MADETPTSPPPQTGNGPGAGGWVPNKKTPIWAALVVGISTAVTPVLMMPEPKWNVIAASVILGASTALATYFGMRSAGPRSS